MSRHHHDIFLVSACLAGLCTRYDGKLKTNHDCLDRIGNAIWIPVCPEQLGGLATPREPADIVGGDGHQVLSGNASVITTSGHDVTAEFINGAKQVLDIAMRQRVKAILLKSRSPSCAVSGTPGVTAALLEQNDFVLEEY